MTMGTNNFIEYVPATGEFNFLITGQFQVYGSLGSSLPDFGGEAYEWIGSDNTIYQDMRIALNGASDATFNYALNVTALPFSL